MDVCKSMSWEAQFCLIYRLTRYPHGFAFILFLYSCFIRAQHFLIIAKNTQKLDYYVSIIIL